MKTLANQNRKSLSKMSALFLIGASSLFLASCNKDEMPTVKPHMELSDNRSEVSKKASPAFTMIIIDHAAAQAAQQAYTIEIKSDGTVLYTGRKNVATLGEMKFKISAELTEKFKNMFIQNNFMEMETLPYIMDYAAISTSFSKSYDMPLITKIDYNSSDTYSSLIELRRAVEKMLGISKYINGKRSLNDLEVNINTQHN